MNLVAPDGRRLSLYDSTRTRDAERLPQDTVRALAATARHVPVSLSHPCAHACTVPATLTDPIRRDELLARAGESPG